MKRISICAFAAQFGLPLAAHAQAANPADASLTVPPAIHASVFAHKKEERALPPPDRIWRRANDAAHAADGGDMPAMAMPSAHADSHEHDHHHVHGGQDAQP